MASLAAVGSESAGELRPAERDFLRQTLENARVQTELARLGGGRARASDLREYAQQLARDFTGLSRDLESLARRRALDVPLQPTSFSDQFRQLTNRPEPEYDRAFLSALTAGTKDALDRCAAILTTAKDSEVRELAGSFLPILRGHANRALELAKER